MERSAGAGRRGPSRSWPPRRGACSMNAPESARFAPDDDDLDRRRGAQAHRRAEIRSPGSKAKTRSAARRSAWSGGHAQPEQLLAEPGVDPLRQGLPQPLLEVEDAHLGARAEPDAEHAVVGAPAPEVGGVDDESRGRRADAAHRDVDVLRPASSAMTSSVFCATWRVSSKVVPDAGRTRSWNWPESTLGKSSRPTRLPTTTMNPPAATRWTRTNARRWATTQATTPSKRSWNRAKNPGRCGSVP